MDSILAVLNYAGDTKGNKSIFELDFYPKTLEVFYMDGKTMERTYTFSDAEKHKEGFVSVLGNQLTSFYVHFYGETGDHFVSHELVKTSTQPYQIGWTVRQQKIVIIMDIDGVPISAWLAARETDDALLGKGESVVQLSGKRKFEIGKGVMRGNAYLVVAYYADGAEPKKVSKKVQKGSSLTCWDVRLKVTDDVLSNNEPDILSDLRTVAMEEINTWAVLFLGKEVDKRTEKVAEEFKKLYKDQQLQWPGWVDGIVNGIGGVVGIGTGAVAAGFAVGATGGMALIAAGIVVSIYTVVSSIAKTADAFMKPDFTTELGEYKIIFIEETVRRLKIEFGESFLHKSEANKAMQEFLAEPENKKKNKDQIKNHFRMMLSEELKKTIK